MRLLVVLILAISFHSLTAQVNVELDCKTGDLLIEFCDGSTAGENLACLFNGGCNECGMLTSKVEDVYWTDTELCVIKDGEQACLSLTSTDTDRQKIDRAEEIDGIIYLSLENDGEAPVTIDIRDFLVDTDEQQIQEFKLEGTNLLLDIERGGDRSVDLSPLIPNDKDEQTITRFERVGDLVYIGIENGNEKSVDVSAGASSYVWNVSADAGTTQEITNSETLKVTGEGVISTETETNEVGISLAPGPDNSIMITSGVDPAWYTIVPCANALTGRLCYEMCDGKKAIYLKD